MTDSNEIQYLSPLQRGQGWRARKGPQSPNTSGFRATGFRILLEPAAVEETTESGIILVAKTIDKEKSVGVICRVVEIGWDAWADKSTDFCDVGDKVLVGQYTGKFHTSEKDGKEYRFVADLDILSTLED
jgi:co-chaperonin GroES (HSP10)